MDLLKEEIYTFNIDLTAIGNPYWIILDEKRKAGIAQAGLICIAFAIAEEATRAIRNRLYIAGILRNILPLHPPPNVLNAKAIATLQYTAANLYSALYAVNPIRRKNTPVAHVMLKALALI
ncbi:hypothetical protein LCER1_G007210 [Lachnellula cervina]|uniref:Uncharacterized protein n=1 Tax=Lachnellula cervina TaxID=1316786 RepID=A0A7D8UJ28_9HELO|nr:hypothetical protein LCER1_G007210 [Lachnellula cervina]